MSLGGGGWISCFGCGDTNSDAVAESERRMVGTEVGDRRGADLWEAGKMWSVPPPASYAPQGLGS
jgi:hypothetical protein